MSTQERNIRAGQVDLWRKGILSLAGVGAPTATTGGGRINTGTEYTDTANGKKYTMTGTRAAVAWTLVGAQT